MLRVIPESFGALGRRLPTMALAISAGRNALYVRRSADSVRLLKHSDTTFGNLLSPLSGVPGDRAWTAEGWQWVIHHALDDDLGLDHQPNWGGLPAVRKAPTGTIPSLAPHRGLVWPGAELMAATEAPFGKDRHLVAPVASPEHWTSVQWTDPAQAETYKVTTAELDLGSDVVRVESFGTVLHRFAGHADGKMLDADRRPTSRRTRGLLSHRPLCLVTTRLVGSEGRLIDREAIDQADSHLGILVAEYDHDQWQQLVLPTLRQLGPSEVARRSGMGRKAISDILRGDSQPRSTTIAGLTAVATLRAAETLGRPRADQTELLAEALAEQNRCGSCGSPVAGRGQYCSERCRSRARRTPVVCPHCRRRRVGITDRPCPCGGKPPVEVKADICPGCGNQRTGAITRPLCLSCRNNQTKAAPQP